MIPGFCQGEGEDSLGAKLEINREASSKQQNKALLPRQHQQEKNNITVGKGKDVFGH